MSHHEVPNAWSGPLLPLAFVAPNDCVPKVGDKSLMMREKRSSLAKTIPLLTLRYRKLKAIYMGQVTFDLEITLGQPHSEAMEPSWESDKSVHST